MAEIRYEHVSKSFDAITVVGDLDLRIAGGELMVLVGPSGCGKTTALRMLAGLEEVGLPTTRPSGRPNVLERRWQSVPLLPSARRPLPSAITSSGRSACPSAA